MKQYLPIIFMTGAILVLIGAATFITGWFLSAHIFTAGAIMVAVAQLTDTYKGKNIVIKRLHKQQMFGALVLLLTALFMYTTNHNEWVVCLCIASFLELYTTFRISHEEKKRSAE